VKLLKQLFGLYGLLVITLVVVMLIPAYFLVFAMSSSRDAKDRNGHRVSRIGSHVLFFLLGIRVKVFNEQILSPSQSYVFVANHTSLLDVPAVILAAPHTFKFLAKAELTKIPLFGYIINNLYLSVKRGSPEDRRRSMDAMNVALKRGVSIFIYPEGTRNKTSEPLGPFYDGAFRLSLETNTSIAVAAIIGSKRLLNNTELRPGSMEIRWQGTVTPTASDSMESLKEKTREMLLAGLRPIG
jgi:1-acyl-sn-glycerol-3-phosphate acyltransferase